MQKDNLNLVILLGSSTILVKLQNRPLPCKESSDMLG